MAAEAVGAGGEAEAEAVEARAGLRVVRVDVAQVVTEHVQSPPVLAQVVALPVVLRLPRLVEPPRRWSRSRGTPRQAMPPAAASPAARLPDASAAVIYAKW